MYNSVQIISEGQKRAIIRVQQRVKNHQLLGLRKGSRNGYRTPSKPFQPKEPWNSDFATSTRDLSDHPKHYIGFDCNGRPSPKKESSDIVSERTLRLGSIRRKGDLKKTKSLKNTSRSREVLQCVQNNNVPNIPGNISNEKSLKAESDLNDKEAITNHKERNNKISSQKLPGTVEIKPAVKEFISRCDGSPQEVILKNNAINNIQLQVSRGFSPLKYDDILEVINIFDEHQDKVAEKSFMVISPLNATKSITGEKEIHKDTILTVKDKDALSSAYSAACLKSASIALDEFERTSDVLCISVVLIALDEIYYCLNNICHEMMTSV